MTAPKTWDDLLHSTPAVSVLPMEKGAIGGWSDLGFAVAANGWIVDSEPDPDDIELFAYPPVTKLQPGDVQLGSTTMFVHGTRVIGDGSGQGGASCTIRIGDGALLGVVTKGPAPADFDESGELLIGPRHNAFAIFRWPLDEITSVSFGSVKRLMKWWPGPLDISRGPIDGSESRLIATGLAADAVLRGEGVKSTEQVTAWLVDAIGAARGAAPTEQHEHEDKLRMTTWTWA